MTARLGSINVSPARHKELGRAGEAFNAVQAAEESFRIMGQPGFLPWLVGRSGLCPEIYTSHGAAPAIGGSTPGNVEQSGPSVTVAMYFRNNG